MTRIFTSYWILPVALVVFIFSAIPVLAEGQSNAKMNVVETITNQEKQRADLFSTSDRIFGANRFETAVEISLAGWPEGADTVVLARGDDFPDALAGTPLALSLNAPILLTETNELTQATANQIEFLEAKEVILLGGEVAISDHVVQELHDMGITTDRISGANRFETAKQIAERIGFDADEVIITDGYNFPDALAIAPQAARNGIPILLTKPDTLPSETETLLSNVSQSTVIGGTVAVNEDVFNQLPSPSRIEGANRFETASEIVKNMDSQSAYVATGMDFADALTGSVLAAKNDYPILLVEPNEVPEPIMEVVEQKNFDRFIAFGGQEAVSNHVLDVLYGRAEDEDEEHDGDEPVNENPVAGKELNVFNEYLAHTRITPAYERNRGNMQNRIDNGEGRDSDYFALRFGLEELIWVYYDGVLPTSSYEQFAMQRVAERQFSASGWDQVDVVEMASWGSLASPNHPFMMIESYSFNNNNDLEWLVVRPVGMRHAFRITIDDPYGSVIRNDAWAGTSNETSDAQLTKVATPELLADIREQGIPVGIGYNDNTADEFNDNGMPTGGDRTDLRKREINRIQSDSVVMRHYGGDLELYVGGSRYQEWEDIEEGSQLIPPSFLEIIEYEAGSEQWMPTDQY